MSPSALKIKDSEERGREKKGGVARGVVRGVAVHDTSTVRMCIPVPMNVVFARRSQNQKFPNLKIHLNLVNLVPCFD